MTTTTTTIIGNLIPDSAHYSNSLILMLFPLAGVVFFEMPLMMFGRKGDAAVHAALLGLLAGSIVSDLSVTANENGLVAFGVIVLAAVLWALYWWNS